MTALRYFSNGVRVPVSEFVIPATDEGLLRGRAVFETLRTHRGRLFRARSHTERLVASARAVDVPTPDVEVLLEELERAVNGYEGDAKVNIILTGGGQRLIRVGPLDQARIGAPVRVATRTWEPPPWLDGRTKHCSRALSEAAVREAGVDEVFWTGHDGAITEATRSNVIAVIDGEIVTPPDDGRILLGVTRAALIEAANSIGLEVRQAPFHPEADFEELYATSTLKDLAPVVELDGRPMTGSGPVGDALRQALQALMDRECAEG